MKFSDIFKKGYGAPAPSDLVEGGIGIDVANKKLYAKATDGTIFQVGLTDAQIAAINDSFSALNAALSQEATTRGSADTQLGNDISGINIILATLVAKTAVQALHATDALRLDIATNAIQLYKGDGTFESISLPVSIYEESKTFSSNGYLKLTNGLILQWYNVGADGTYAWPVAFTTACFSAQGTLKGVGSAATNTHNGVTAGITTFTTTTGVDGTNSQFIFGIGV